MNAWAAAGQAAAEITGQVYSATQQEENQRRSIAAQERMAKNKIQWSVSDLRKAGLNPILAAPNSIGAGGPSGAGASGAPSGSSNIISAAAAYKQAIQQENMNEATIAKLEADRRLADANARLSDEQAITQKTVQGLNSASEARVNSELIRRDPLDRLIESVDLGDYAESTGKAIKGFADKVVDQFRKKPSNSTQAQRRKNRNK